MLVGRGVCARRGLHWGMVVVVVRALHTGGMARVVHVAATWKRVWRVQRAIYDPALARKRIKGSLGPLAGGEEGVRWIAAGALWGDKRLRTARR